MTAVNAPRFRSDDDQPIASVRRGVCPSLSKPMQTGDGLLVRLRPASGGLSPVEIRAVARAAAEFGNGILEVTARGNLQIRGLKPETVEPLTQAVFATGMDLATGLAVETPPLSGLDRAEVVDPRPLAARIRAAVLAESVPLVLAAKLSVIVDGGGTFDLDAIVADIRLKALDAGSWVMTLGGTADTGRVAGVVSDEMALDAVMAALRQLHAIGPSARARDVDVMALKLSPAKLLNTARDVPSVRRPAGHHVLADGVHVAGLGLPFCQVKADALMALADRAEALDVSDIRLAPDHGLLVAGLSAENTARLLDGARALGFRVRADDPANAISLCAGTAGCASAYFDTHALADLVIAKAPDLLDGSFDLHLSACSKGCAHPAATLLALVGAPLGYGVVVNGSASASPEAYIAANDVASAVQRLSALVRTEKEAGESARSCLTRLGAERVAAALRQE